MNAFHIASACTCVLLITPIAGAADIDQLIGNSFTNSDKPSLDDGPPSYCRITSERAERTLQLQRADRERVIAHLAKTDFTRATSEISTAAHRRKCADWSGSVSSTSEITFELSNTRFSQVVLTSTDGGAGEEEKGRYQIAKDGRNVVLRYDGGIVRSYTASEPFRLVSKQAGTLVQGGGVTLPNASPDLTLVCRTLSVANRSGSNTNASGYSSTFGGYTSNSSDGSTRNSSDGSTRNSSDGSTRNWACNDSNWQSRRLSFSVWFGPKVCNTSQCEITERGFKWSGGYLDRQTGQFEDGCFLYSCEKSSVQERKF